jgi:hypothetical protein
MPPVVFEPIISADEWPKNYALDQAATGTGTLLYYFSKFYCTSYQPISVAYFG